MSDANQRGQENVNAARNLPLSEHLPLSIHHRSSRGLDPLQIKTLASGDWMRHKQNLILTGATGTGKSWLACAFGQLACR